MSNGSREEDFVYKSIRPDDRFGLIGIVGCWEEGEW